MRASWIPARLRCPRVGVALVLLVLPAVLLAPSLFGGHTYLPWSVAAWPPLSYELTGGQLAELRATANRDITEIPVWVVPQLEEARQQLAAGQLPLWTPHARGGSVLMTHGADGLLYPPAWLALARTDPRDGLVWTAYVNFALAALLTFGLLRALGLPAAAALLGAVVYGLSGTLCANGHFYMRLGPLVWLPGMLWAATSVAGRTGIRRWRASALLALCTALVWIAGFPPYAVPVTFLAALWCLVLWIREHRRHGARAGLATAGWLLLGGGAGMALAMPQMLPVLEFFQVAERATERDLARASHTVFTPGGLLGLVLPEAFGHPTAPELPYDRSPLAWWWLHRTEWTTGRILEPNFNFTEYTVFVGTAGLVLAVLGLRRSTWFPALGCLLLFALACGLGPLKYVFALPGWQVIPPLRCLAPAILLLAWLAAAGVRTLLEGDGIRRCAVAAAVCAAVALAALGLARAGGDTPLLEALGMPGAVATHYAPMQEGSLSAEQVRAHFTTAEGRDLIALGSERLAGELDDAALAFGLLAVLLAVLPLLRRRASWLPAALLAGFTAAELIGFGAPLNQGVPRKGTADTALHRWLVARDREAAAAGGIQIARAERPGREPGLPRFLVPGTLGPRGIRDLHAYTYFDRWSNRPLERLYADHETFLLAGSTPKTLPDDPRLGHPYFDLIGLDYLVAPAPLQNAGPPVFELPGRHPGQGLYVHARPDALPRAFVVPRRRVLRDDEAVVAALVRPDLDPRAAVLLPASEAGRLPSLAPDPAAADRTVRFVSESGGRLTVAVGDGPPGHLVLADTALPGWHATVDGTGVPVARGNQWMRVIALPAGPCTVVFSYTPPGLGGGILLAVLGLAALAGGNLLSRRHEKPDDTAV